MAEFTPELLREKGQKFITYVNLVGPVVLQQDWLLQMICTLLNAVSSESAAAAMEQLAQLQAEQQQTKEEGAGQAS